MDNLKKIEELLQELNNNPIGLQTVLNQTRVRVGVIPEKNFDIASLVVQLEILKVLENINNKVQTLENKSIKSEVENETLEEKPKPKKPAK